MVDVLEEVTSGTITKEHVVKRIDDWVDRLNRLYALVERWLPPGWKVVQHRVVQMNEEMMQTYKVAPRELPVLDLENGSGRAAYLEPRGLWIVGTNGRVDLYAGEKHYLILDRSEAFAKPDWSISDFNKRSKHEKLDRGSFRAALAE